MLKILTFVQIVQLKQLIILTLKMSGRCTRPSKDKYPPK